ncbi:MAG: hypothetical protein IJ679_06825 [Lachnospiraceae bacterium]|nr:hypothetical protein [Lachnospiraceae bacterium]
MNKENPLLQYHAAWSNEKYRGLGIGKYQKNDGDTFGILMNCGNPKLASRYARRIIEEHNCLSPADIAPGTKVYELVEELAKYLPDEYRKRFV